MNFGRLTWMLLGVSGLAFGSLANQVYADVIINEFNAVSGGNFLSEQDSFFGTIAGNGGNWIELLVVGEGFGTTVDMTGYQINWGEDESDNGEYESAELGTIVFGDDPLWSAVQSGTIITIVETDNDGLTPTDTSFNGVDDWHINVATLEEFGNANPLITADTGENGIGDDGMFSVGADAWFGEVRDAEGNLLFGPVGEDVDNWGGGGVNNEETGRLELSTTGGLTAYQSATALNFDDSDNSTFGTANVWSGGDNVQNFAGLRTAAVPEPSSLTILALGTTAMLSRRRRRA